MKQVYLVHIPKVAGISMKQAFLNKYVFGGADLFDVKSDTVNSNQDLKRNLRQFVQTKKYSTFPIGDGMEMTFGKHENIYEKVKDLPSKFCFTFVRNPWDRFVSIYFYGLKENYIKQGTPFDTLIRLLYDNQDLPDKLNGVIFRPEALSDVMNVKGFRPQVDWICDPAENLYVDFVGKYESLQSDFDKVCDLIGIERMTLKIANASSHTHYSQYYTEETKKMVGEIYRKDVTKFNYAFQTT